MNSMIPDRPESPEDGLDGSRPSSPTSPPRPGALSHRQARGWLTLALDPTTEPAVLAALQQHVASCERCQQELRDLRRAEAWFVAQPVELPQMAAAQDAAWAKLQARIGAEGAAHPASNGHAAPAIDAALVAGNGHLNGHHKVAPAPEVEPDEQPVEEAAEAQEKLPAAPAPLALVPVPPRVVSKTNTFTPMKALIAVLAASFIMSSIALLAVHFSSGQSSQGHGAGAPPIADILDPGNATISLGFDPTSRKLFALASNLRADCDDTHCTSASTQAAACVWLSSLSADSGAKLWSRLPDCMRSSSGAGLTFTTLFMDTTLGQLALVDSARQVVTLDLHSQATTANYTLACCSDTQTETGQTWLDTHDHLLLTATTTKQDDALKTLAAQSVKTGQIAYQTNLDGSALQGAVVSAATGWLYLWTDCPGSAAVVCVESYEATNGQKMGNWQVSANSAPLAADPTDALLYVRDETADGAAETLVLNARTGAQVGQLPAASAIAFDSPLHHAYLLNDDGVTVVDTRTRRTLSTLPVLAHDSTLWATPAVDERFGRVYLPTMRGKVLTAQDDAAGHLRLSSPTLQATLDAERAMTNTLQANKSDLDPDDLPVGPGELNFYYAVDQAMPDGCHHLAAPARTQSAATRLSGGDYTVTISLAWGDTANQAKQPALDASPPPQASYPHQHAWEYHIPVGGGAAWAGEQGEALPTC
ncbi:MAG TPA: hypothetical protein VF099_07050 [Ktedonobacterales bacterium]